MNHVAVASVHSALVCSKLTIDLILSLFDIQLIADAMHWLHDCLRKNNLLNSFAGILNENWLLVKYDSKYTIDNINLSTGKNWNKSKEDTEREGKNIGEVISCSARRNLHVCATIQQVWHQNEHIHSTAQHNTLTCSTGIAMWTRMNIQHLKFYV